MYKFRCHRERSDPPREADIQQIATGFTPALAYAKTSAKTASNFVQLKL